MSPQSTRHWPLRNNAGFYCEICVISLIYWIPCHVYFQHMDTGSFYGNRRRVRAALGNRNRSSDSELSDSDEEYFPPTTSVPAEHHSAEIAEYTTNDGEENTANSSRRGMTIAKISVIWKKRPLQRDPLEGELSGNSVLPNMVWALDRPFEFFLFLYGDYFSRWWFIRPCSTLRNAVQKNR